MKGDKTDGIITEQGVFITMRHLKQAVFCDGEIWADWEENKIQSLYRESGDALDVAIIRCDNNRENLDNKKQIKCHMSTSAE